MPQRFDRWQQLSAEECLRLLAQRHLGRIAVIDDDRPMILPVTYVVDGETVLFRIDQGSTVRAAAYGSDQVAFEVDVIDERRRTGWSVLVRGTVEQVTEPAELGRLRQLPLYPWAPGAKASYVRIEPTLVSGRRVSVPSLPSTWLG
jgi:nitroimidazol reductase NimA-like FMN-containing flavoprotein (pyridoxamine 5'-phosphate oxidase superfamily)